jgi:hypothetical protein
MKSSPVLPGQVFGVMAGPVPAIPMLKSAAPHATGITGTRPVMTTQVNVRLDSKEVA